MARRRLSHPTELELEILKRLWREGPMTVREVRESLEDDFRKLAHTSVITIMNIMVEKAHVTKAKGRGGYVYKARIRRESTLKRMMGDLVDRAYEGSAAAAAMQLLEGGPVSARELEQLRELLDRKAEEDGK